MHYDDVIKDYLKLVKLRTERPSLRGLGRIVRSFHRMPYENLTKIVMLFEHGEPEKRLRMPDTVFSDHMTFGAGGTCFSLTYFFWQILLYCGYDPYPVLCDRSYGPDTHCALIVKLDGCKYLVDPGYLVEAPLLVPPFGESVQDLPSARIKLARLGNSSQLILVTERDGKARVRYRLKDTHVSFDFFKERWLDSFDWAMMRHLCVSRQTGDSQLFMRDGVMRKSDKNSSHQGSVKLDFASEIETNFGISKKLVENAGDCLKILFGKGPCQWKPR